MKIPLTSLGEPFYEGSVQRLYAVPEDDTVMVTRTSSRGSVFDVGALFEIPGNDVNRAVFRHVLYSRLAEPEFWRSVKESIKNAPELSSEYREGLLDGALQECIEKGALTHHRGMLDAETGVVVCGSVPEHPSACNVVKKFQILKPTRCHVLGAHLYDYAIFPHSDRFVVPLEYIVRFGITSASSVYKKYRSMDGKSKAQFERELGVSKPLEAWQYLEKPVSDFTSKFEAEDRMVSKQEALVMCGLSGDQFGRSSQLAVLGAWAVRHLLEQIGLLVWDIKWEFANNGNEIVFVDTIDPDSFRATVFVEGSEGKVVVHCNKQAMRDYFTIFHGDWIEAIAEAKERGRKEGVDFTGILKAGQEQGTAPGTPTVDKRFITIQEEKMNLIRAFMTGEQDAEKVKEQLLLSAEREVAFYRESGKMKDLLALNGVEGAN